MASLPGEKTGKPRLSPEKLLAAIHASSLAELVLAVARGEMRFSPLVMEIVHAWGTGRPDAQGEDANIFNGHQYSQGVSMER